MKKILMVLLVALAITIPTVNAVEPFIDIPENINVIAGGDSVLINITYSGEEIEIYFTGESSNENVEVEYQPNPIVITEDSVVTMYINTSINAYIPDLSIKTNYEEYREGEEKPNNGGITTWTGTYSKDTSNDDDDTTDNSEGNTIEDNSTENNDNSTNDSSIDKEGEQEEDYGEEIQYILLLVLFWIVVLLIFYIVKKRRNERNENKK